MIRDKRNTRILFMGTPDFAVAILSHLINNDYNIVGIVTVPDKPSGRGLKVNKSAVKNYIESTGLQIPVFQPVILKDPIFANTISELKADIIIVVAFRMLPKIIWSIPSLGTFNLHASLLPQYRGAAPINWAIINGEKETGVTTFLLDEKTDTGAILLQEKVEIEDNDNAGTLHDKLEIIGSQLVCKTIDQLICQEANPKRQELINPSYKPAPKLNRETSRINWNGNHIAINNLIRGLSPYPTAYSTLTFMNKSIEIKIFDSSIITDQNIDCGERLSKPGDIYSDRKTLLIVQCGEGLLKIEELQVAGKKRLKIRDFLAGLHDDINYASLS